ncbi:MAG: hypothetical protein Q9179_004784 [Wetmoreana sp. 5 TL-2023]
MPQDFEAKAKSFFAKFHERCACMLCITLFDVNVGVAVAKTHTHVLDIDSDGEAKDVVTPYDNGTDTIGAPQMEGSMLRKGLQRLRPHDQGLKYRKG